MKQQPENHSPPIISPDGNWRWTGAQWLPNPTNTPPGAGEQSAGLAGEATAPARPRASRTKPTGAFLWGAAAAILLAVATGVAIGQGGSQASGSTSAAEDTVDQGFNEAEELFLQMYQGQMSPVRYPDDLALEMGYGACERYADGDTVSDIYATIERVNGPAGFGELNNEAGYLANLAIVTFCPEYEYLNPEYVNNIRTS